jgi:uncharacterized protein (TIGR00661 family)
MAKIIYGVSGQGFGHSTRSRETIKYLISQGHQVLVFTYGQAVFFLGEDFDVFEVPGLKISYKNNKVVYWETIYDNFKKVIEQSRSWKKILDRFRQFNPDLVITDFEPLTSLLAKVQRTPLLSFDNQHQLIRTRVKIPSRYQKDLLADKLVIRSMVRRANHYLITSFFETPVIRKNTDLVPPVVRQEVLDLKPQKQDFILVYQTSDFSDIAKSIKGMDQKFVVVGMHKAEIDGNIEYRNFSNAGDWLDLLSNCKAMIGNAGASLISEALFLSKPLLVVPIKKQVEQVVNAKYLEAAGYGIACPKFSRTCLSDFLNRLPEFEKNLQKYPHTDNKKTFKRLDELIDKLV